MVPGRIKGLHHAMPRPVATSVAAYLGDQPAGTPFRCRSARSRCTAWLRKVSRRTEVAGPYRQQGRPLSSGLRRLLEFQQEVRDPREFIQNLRSSSTKRCTFTPKGQVKAFPRGATPIDFAY